MMQRPARRVFWWRCLFVAGSLLAGCLLAELAARLLYRESTVLFPRYHTGARYGDYALRRLRPDSRFRHVSVDGAWEFRINRAGLRNDREFARPKPAGRFRVLCLGDSHTLGYEVRQECTYSAVIEQHLRRAGLDAETVNAGVSGFSTAEALAFLENEGVHYQPDVVVLGFFANDYEDNLKAGLFKLDVGGGLIVVKTDHLPGVRIQDTLYSIPGTKWLGEHSYAYATAFNAVWNFYKVRLAEQARAGVVEESAVATRTDVDEIERKLAGALLRRMADFCRRQNIKFMVLDLPSLDMENRIKPSMTPATRTEVAGFADWHIPASVLLEQGLAPDQLHVPHGQRHISEATHAALGRLAAEKIMEWNRAAGPRQTPSPR